MEAMAGPGESQGSDQARKPGVHLVRLARDGRVQTTSLAGGEGPWTCEGDLPQLCAVRRLKVTFARRWLAKRCHGSRCLDLEPLNSRAQSLREPGEFIGTREDLLAAV